MPPSLPPPSAHWPRLPLPAFTAGRRSFLGASLAAAFSGARALAGSAPAGGPPPRARACILLYMAGGPSHIDTFDPKPGRGVGGPFRAIPTSVTGLRVSEHLPRLAGLMKEMALVRSLTAKEGNHDRARHLMHTSYAPQGGADHPAFGALVAEAHEKPPADDAAAPAASPSRLPGYVSIAGPGEDSGFLSAAYSPFPVKNPDRPVKHLTTAKGVDDERFQRRLALWRGLEDRFARGAGGAFARSRREVGEKAVDLMSAGVEAFDLSREPEAVHAAYGATKFGAGCLMARRLIEAGVPFVEVTLDGWDTHEDNFNRVKALSGTLDQAMSVLLQELAGRGLLATTLVAWMGDFGRTPRINERGGRDHFPAASSVLLAGGGIRGGQVVGATDEDGAEVRERPVTVPDLYRTIARATGLDADRMRVSPAGRPIKTVEAGHAIEELL